VTYDSDMQQMMDKIASDMATNKSDYASGMREVSGIGKGGTGNGQGGKKGDGKDSNFSGAVLVSYDISYIDGTKRVPRTARGKLYTPGYKAKGGGVVEIEVRINRNGSVVSATVKSSTNSELNNIALSAAKNSKTLFNIDANAPISNIGTITYTFVAQ
jgi:TonB family protein